MREVENVHGRIEYMMENPVRAGLAVSPYDYRWFWSTGEGARASTNVFQCTSRSSTKNSPTPSSTTNAIFTPGSRLTSGIRSEAAT